MALENKLGLTSSADLAREEERISKKKSVELFESDVLDTLPAGKFSTLQAIHKYLPTPFGRAMGAAPAFGLTIS